MSRAVDPLGRGSTRHARLGTGHRDPKRLQPCSEAAKCSFAARFCPLGCPRKVDSFTRPVARLAPRHPNRRCLGSPRAGSPAATLSDRRLREAILDASGRLMQPTLSKTSTHAPGSQRRSFRQSRWCRRAPRFNDAGLTSASGSRCRTECSRLSTVSLGLVSGALSPSGRCRALERASHRIRPI